MDFTVPNPTQHSEQAEGRPQTKRQQRALRGAKTLHSHRVFTANENQAHGKPIFQTLFMSIAFSSHVFHPQADTGALQGQWLGDPTPAGEERMQGHGFRQALPKQRPPRRTPAADVVLLPRAGAGSSTDPAPARAVPLTLVPKAFPRPASLSLSPRPPPPPTGTYQYSAPPPSPPPPHLAARGPRPPTCPPPPPAPAKEEEASMEEDADEFMPDWGGMWNA